MVDLCLSMYLLMFEGGDSGTSAFEKAPVDFVGDTASPVGLDAIDFGNNLLLQFGAGRFGVVGR